MPPSSALTLIYRGLFDAERVAAKIRREADFGRFASEVTIVTGYYSLETGRVVWTKR